MYSENAIRRRRTRRASVRVARNRRPPKPPKKPRYVPAEPIEVRRPVRRKPYNVRKIGRRYERKSVRSLLAKRAPLSAVAAAIAAKPKYRLTEKHAGALPIPVVLRLLRDTRLQALKKRTSYKGRRKIPIKATKEGILINAITGYQKFLQRMLSRGMTAAQARAAWARRFRKNMEDEEMLMENARRLRRALRRRPRRARRRALPARARRYDENPLVGPYTYRRLGRLVRVPRYWRRPPGARYEENLWDETEQNPWVGPYTYRRLGRLVRVPRYWRETRRYDVNPRHRYDDTELENAAYELLCEENPIAGLLEIPKKVFTSEVVLEQLAPGVAGFIGSKALGTLIGNKIGVEESKPLGPLFNGAVGLAGASIVGLVTKNARLGISIGVGALAGTVIDLARQAIDKATAGQTGTLAKLARAGVGLSGIGEEIPEELKSEVERAIQEATAGMSGDYQVTLADGRLGSDYQVTLGDNLGAYATYEEAGRATPQIAPQVSGLGTFVQEGQIVSPQIAPQVEGLV